MGVDPLANLGHAGRGAVPGAAAIQRVDKRGRERRQRREIWVTYKHWRKCIEGKCSIGERMKKVIWYCTRRMLRPGRWYYV